MAVNGSAFDLENALNAIENLMEISGVLKLISLDFSSTSFSNKHQITTEFLCLTLFIFGKFDGNIFDFWALKALVNEL